MLNDKIYIVHKSLCTLPNDLELCLFSFLPSVMDISVLLFVAPIPCSADFTALPTMCEI